MYIYHELTQEFEVVNTEYSILSSLSNLLDQSIDHYKDFLIIPKNWAGQYEFTAFYDKSELACLIRELQEIHDNMHDDVVTPKESPSVREYFLGKVPWEYNDEF